MASACPRWRCRSPFVHLGGKRYAHAASKSTRRRCALPVLVIPEGGLPSGLVAGHRVEPATVALGPRLHPLGGPDPLAQEQLGEAVAGAELVVLGHLPGPHEVAQGFMGGVGDPDRREIARPVAARELGGVPPVGLHPIARLRRDERGSDDITVDAEPRELPVEDVAAGAGFVTHPEVPTGAELPDQLRDGLRAVGDDPQGADLAARFRHGHGNGFGVDIQPDMAQVRRHRPAPFACSSAWFGSSRPRNLRPAIASRSFHMDYTPDLLSITVCHLTYRSGWEVVTMKPVLA